MSRLSPKYFLTENLTLVDQPRIQVFRAREDDFGLRATMARLLSEDETVKQVRLEGDVEGDLGGGLRFQTAQGVYNVEDEVFYSDREVRLFGRGFEVVGVGLRLSFATEQLEFLSAVRSVFNSSSGIPKNLPTRN